MWRREVIRLVLALNWCVFGWSFLNAAYMHRVLWGMNCGLMAQEDFQSSEKERTDREADGAWAERRIQYQGRTKLTFDSGQRGWWTACGASLGTAVLLMIAFPKKPQTGEPGPPGPRVPG